MATEIKITEVQQSRSLEDEASLLVTQVSGGVETLFRSPYAQLFAKLAGKTPVVQELPEPSAALRGSIVIYDDGRGDLLYVCVGNTDGTYVWIPLGEEGGLPPATPEDEGMILRVDDTGEWNKSKDLTTLEDKVPWDIYEVIENHAEFDGENLILEGNNISFDGGIVTVDDPNVSYDDGYVIFS